MSEAAFDAFIDAFLEQPIEANGLVFGGGGRREWKGFVTLERRGSATDGHRQLVQRWRESQSQIVGYQVGLFVDAWYPANARLSRRAGYRARPMLPALDAKTIAEAERCI